MSAGVLIGCVVLGLFGSAVALYAWFVLRLTVGGFWAFLGFSVTLVTTIWVLFQLIP